MGSKNTILTILQRAPLNLETGCWEWTGTQDKDGYGKVKYNGKYWSVHRLMYSFICGNIPDVMFVCHKCDRPCCVNPNHLFLGTPKDNYDDMVAKGRRKGNIKVTRSDISTIQNLRSSKVSVVEVAKKFNVTEACINKITSKFGFDGQRKTKSVQLERSGLVLHFKSIRAAARYLSVAKSTVSKYLHNNKILQGYTITYYQDAPVT